MLWFTLLLAVLSLVTSCSTSRDFTSESTSAYQMTALSMDSIGQRITVSQRSSSEAMSHLVFVTIDPNIDVTHTYGVTLPDGQKIDLPNNATGYGVQTEAAADSSSLAIDGQTVNLSGAATSAAADSTQSTHDHQEQDASSGGMLGSLRTILMTIGALAACAVVFYLRVKFR